VNTNVWLEPGGHLLKEALLQEARTLNRLHRPPTRLDDWLAYRERLRERLMAAAGTFPDPPALDLREHGTVRMDGYRIVKLTYQSRPGLRVTANLFVPDAPGRHPAVLNVHGHFPQGKVAVEVAARGHTLAPEGFVVLSVDAIGAGERGPAHGKPGASLLSVGETLLGMQVYDNMRAIDLLQSLDCVDPGLIGVTGASGGGNQTMWISALDPRVKAAVPVVSVGTFEAYVTHGNCWCETLPDGLNIAEEWGVLGLIAPNPLLVLTAHREQIDAFVEAEMLRAYADARRIYSLYGAEERLAYQILDLPHGYFPEMRRHMLGWFKHWLQGQGPPLPRTLPKDPALPESALKCFPGKSRPKDIKPLIEYVSFRSKALKKVFLHPGKLDRNDKRRELARLLRRRDGPHHVRLSEVVSGEEEGRRYQKFTVESEPGVLLPCLLIQSGKRASSVVIAAHPDGKEACFREAAAKEVLTKGKSLCLVDLRNTGETRWAPPDDEMDHFTARSALWLGRTMVGDWTKDLSAVRAALSKITPSTPLELLGFGGTVAAEANDPAALARGAFFGLGDAAIAALAAATLDNRFAGVTVVGLLSTYVLDGAMPAYRYGVLVPGILRWGDISLIAALAHCPVRVESLVHPAGRPLSSKERAAWVREVRQLSRRLTQERKDDIH